MEKTLMSLLNEIAVNTDPLSLALDDHHLLAEMAILEVMKFLIHQQPHPLHFSVSARSEMGS
jgi:ATP/maltotriose-dependent transcriptional regulator MalT